MHDDLVQLCQKRLKQTSNKKVRPCKIQERDFVHKRVLSFQPDSRSKCMPNYEGTCAMTLVTTNGDKPARPVNTGAFKKYSFKNKSSISRKSEKATFDSKHLQIKDSEQGHSKLLGRITVIVFNVPSHTFTIFQIFQRSVEPCEAYINIRLENGYTPEEKHG
ncbi:hypothetical protein MTR_5g055770 [Medicago truncatula]|uniref:Uncharacterized protein n=1 Tax=Medicago truncatula TaxID=3880 RepID=G7K0G9_MEDTR|nr:hypothetical protein MTR_5g055770 [Medicago truncatula]